jgi:hypothetical protein
MAEYISWTFYEALKEVYKTFAPVKFRVFVIGVNELKINDSEICLFMPDIWYLCGFSSNRRGIFGGVRV